MSALDVKYVVIVEFINDVGLSDSVAFYTTHVNYAAGLARSFEHAKIFTVGTVAPHLGALIEHSVTRVAYAMV